MAWQRFSKSATSEVAGADSDRAETETARVRHHEARRALIARLDATIGKLEGRWKEKNITADEGRSGRIVFGVTEIDASLGGGLASNALHEVRAATALDLPAAAGFAGALGGLLTRFGMPLFWISERSSRLETGEFYGPGLAALGIDPSLLVRVRAADCSQALWAAGEVAASPGAGVCLLELRGNPARADLAFSRRLALRAQERGVTVIMLRHSGGEEASAAATRWRVSPLTSGEERAAMRNGQSWVGLPSWEVALEKCRGGRPGVWKLEWRHDERLFTLSRRTTIHRVSATAAAALPGRKPAADLDRPHSAAAMGSRLALDEAS